MLGNLEARLVGIVRAGIAARAHLTVGVGPLDPPAAGRGNVALALSTIAPDIGFAPFETDAVGPADKPQARRVLPLQFRAEIDFVARPAADSVAARTAARTLLLEDMSAVAYLLADPAVQTGAAFADGNADPGFRVLRFGLVAGTAPPAIVDNGYSGQLVVQGHAQLWPIGVASDEGVIAEIDQIVLAVPTAAKVADVDVRPGGTPP